MVQTLIEKMVNLLFFDMFYIIAAICQAGFIGKYCDEQCEFPMYGYGCQQRCLCSKTRYSISNGCSKIKSSEFFKRIIFKIVIHMQFSVNIFFGVFFFFRMKLLVSYLRYTCIYLF